MEVFDIILQIIDFSSFSIPIIISFSHQWFVELLEFLKALQLSLNNELWSFQKIPKLPNFHLAAGLLELSKALQLSFPSDSLNSDFQNF